MLLLESPEPLEWARIELSCSGGISVQALWNEDQTRAFIYKSSGTGAPLFENGTYTFTFRYRGDVRERLPIWVNGTSVDVQVECSVQLSSRAAYDVKLNLRRTTVYDF